MEFRPILSSLRRSPTGAILVALQIALALAITVNSLYIISQRLERIGRDSGHGRAEHCSWSRSRRSARRSTARPRCARTCRCCAALPGVAAATAINADPAVGRRIVAPMYYAEPGEKGKQSPGNYFEVDEHGHRHARRQAGRGPQLRRQRGTQARAQQLEHACPRSILTRAVAKELFPGEPAARQDRVRRPRPAGARRRHHRAHARLVAELGQVRPRRAAPGHPGRASMARYMVRAKPGQRDAMMQLAEEKLERDRQRPHHHARCARSSTSPPTPTRTIAPWRCT